MGFWDTGECSKIILQIERGAPVTHDERIQGYQEIISDIIRMEVVMEEFRVDEVREKLKMTEDPVIRVDFATEVKKRQDRRKLVNEKQWVKFQEIESKLHAVMEGSMLPTAIGKVDHRWVEGLYARTMEYAQLSPVQEANLRNRLRKQAEADLKEGLFPTLKEALQHYNLKEE